MPAPRPDRPRTQGVVHPTAPGCITYHTRHCHIYRWRSTGSIRCHYVGLHLVRKSPGKWAEVTAPSLRELRAKLAASLRVPF